MRSRLERIDGVLARLEGWAVTALVSAMVVLAVTQIALRNLLSSSIPVADTLLRHGVLWVGFIGAALAAHEGCHIRIDIGARLLPTAMQRWVETFFHLISVVICLLLAQASWRFLMLDLKSGATIGGVIPVWALQAILPAAFGLLAFHFLVKAVTGVVSTASTEEPEGQ